MFRPTRLERLRAKMDALQADAFCVRDTPNIAWVTGFDDVFDDERAHTALITQDSFLLHSDSRYVTALQREAEGSPVQVDAEIVKTDAWIAAQSKAACTSILAIEDSMPLFEFRNLEKALAHDAATALLETHDAIIGLRAVKDDAEIARLKAAQAITDAAFAACLPLIKPGMTELEVRNTLEQLMFAQGAQGLAFPTIIACGQNGASPHAQPSEKVLEAGMCVVMDFGARAGGYCSDMTRTVFLGKPDARMLTAWETILTANEGVQMLLAPGVTGREAQEFAEGVLEANGFGGRMGHGLGHGVGLEIHELPVLSTRNEAPLEPGNVVTVEPGIYLPGEFGMRLEDFGVITQHGFERFTSSTHDLIVL